jgi:hypothetical protein
MAVAASILEFPAQGPSRSKQESMDVMMRDVDAELVRSQCHRIYLGSTK